MMTKTDETFTFLSFIIAPTVTKMFPWSAYGGVLWWIRHDRLPESAQLVPEISQHRDRR